VWSWVAVIGMHGQMMPRRSPSRRINASYSRLMARATLSARKYKQLAVEALRNSLRLFKDAQMLFAAASWPTAFQLTVLAIEEFSKARWVDHVYYTAITNNGLPGEQEEQGLLRELYHHQPKQEWYLREGFFNFSPRLHREVEAGLLDRRKQEATYVGLPKRGKRIDVNARISVPARIKEAEAKQLMSLFAKELREVYELLERNETYFGIEQMDEVVMSHEFVPAFSWPHKRTGLKSARFRQANYAP
jgi:AbiV family abortive infection protein